MILCGSGVRALGDLISQKAKHVIRASGEVNNESTSLFIESLYKSLLSGQPVCLAFKRAKELTAKKLADPKSLKVEILRGEGHSQLECTQQYWPGCKGTWHCLSEHKRFKANVAIDSNAYFTRSDDQCTGTLQDLLSENKLMCLQG